MKSVKGAESGFTILEVLVAATVFLVGLSLLISLLNTTLGRLGTDDLEAAGALAKSAILTASVGTDAAAVDTVLVCSGKKYHLHRTITTNGRLVGVMVTVQRHKQTRLLVNAYAETAIETH